MKRTMKKITFWMIPLCLVMAVGFYGCAGSGGSSLSLPGDTNTFSFGGSGTGASGAGGATTSLKAPTLPASDSQLAPHAPQQVIVRYNGTSVNPIAASVQATVVRTFSIRSNQYATLQIPSGATVVQTIQKLKANSSVVYAEPNWYRSYKALPTGTGYTQYQWAPANVNATGVWTGGSNGSVGDPAVVIGIADTGVNGSHLDLVANTQAGFDYADNFSGSEGSGTTTCPSGLTAATGGGCTIPAGVNSDQVGHGTLVASTADAKGDDGNSVGVAGICWHCTIEPIKLFGSNGTFTTVDLEVQALVDAANAPNARLPKKPDVINMSYGGPVFSNIEADGINYALQSGIVLVAAAGNSANAELSFPAAYPGVIAAGASDANNNVASFSTQGSFVALVAPGVQMYGANNTGNDAYQSGDGTSFASPMTSGAVALLDSLLIDNGGSVMTPDKAATILESTADKVSGMNGANFTPAYGYGHLDVLNAANHTSMASAMGSIKVTVEVGGSPACDWDVLLENSSGQAVNDTLTGDASSASPYAVTSFSAGTAYFFLVPTSGNPYTLVIEPPNYESGAGTTTGPTCGSNASAGSTKQTVTGINVTAGSTVNAGTVNFP